MDFVTRAKWDRAAANFDLMSSRGPEWRWAPAKREFFSAMQGRILFLAVGTGLDIPFFPPDQDITGIDISPKMLEIARPRADAYAGNRAVVTYLIEKELLANLKVQGRMMKPPVVLTIGVRKDWPILAGILDRALAAITQEEVRRIHRKWLAVFESGKAVTILTPEERAWLDAHPVIRLGFHKDWEPAIIIDENGELSGFLVDFFDQLNREFGTNIIIETGAWPDIVQRARNQEIDGLLACAPMQAKASGLLPTHSHFTVYPAIFARESAQMEIRGFRDLEGKTVAKVKGYAFAKPSSSLMKRK